jgi:hypothetical protein
LEQLKTQAKTQEMKNKKEIIEKRKMNHSVSVSAERAKSFEQRPQFNNKTKDGELIDGRVQSVPYVFIPKYKNETFIMPDRVFEKGKAGKRCINYIMKFTSK